MRGLGLLSMGLVAMVATGCASTRPSASAPTSKDAISCSDGPRYAMNCESQEWAYEGKITDTSGGLKVTEWVGLEAEYKSETKAIQQVGEGLKMYAGLWRRLCQEYNSCAISQGEYQRQSTEIREKVTPVTRAYQEMAAGNQGVARRQALANAYSAIVPQAQQIGLSLRFSVLDEQERAVGQGQAFRTGERLAFSIETSKPAYVYLLQQDGSGKIDVLFPDSRMPVSNPIQSNTQVRIPDGNRYYQVNDQDIGTEYVYIVASLNRLTTMEQAASAIAQGGTLSGPASRLTEIGANAGQERCTRGLELEAQTSEAKCTRTRGLVFEDDRSQGGASLTARTEAADTVIAQVFLFEHLR